MAKILIVEDDKFLRELIVQKLGKEGYDLVEAIDGEDGVAQAKKEVPDLILLDLILPGIDGFEALTQIKAD
ncbi:MAG: response regulator, partial [bacterium]|nr:response regulator [bacterium]